VALVSRRLRALVNSPVLFESVVIDLHGHRTAQRVKALPLWLHRHIRPVHCMVWRGMQRLEGPQASQSGRQHEAVLTITALTTTAAVAARLCSLHIVLDVPLLTLVWLPMLATTLERLIIDTRRHLLRVDACLGSMTALSQLSLTASSSSLTAGVKLPPRLTSLQFVATGPTVALPRQVSNCDSGTMPSGQALLLLTSAWGGLPCSSHCRVPCRACMPGLLINDCRQVAVRLLFVLWSRSCCCCWSCIAGA
jgi:hypothetical protein